MSISYYLEFSKDLQGRAKTVFSKIHEEHKLYAATYDKLTEGKAGKYLYQIQILQSSFDVFSLRLLLCELEVLKHLSLLSQEASETLIDLIMSKDVSNHLVALYILKNKSKEKKQLEKKGNFAKEFNDIITNYSKLIDKTANDMITNYSKLINKTATDRLLNLRAKP